MIQRPSLGHDLLLGSLAAFVGDFVAKHMAPHLHQWVTQ